MKRTGYKVVYNYNGYELSAGNPIVFPKKELAEKYLRNYASRSWFNHELYIVESEYNGDELKPCREFNGKPVYNESWNYGIDAMEIGDYVEEDVVDNYMNCLPPVSYRMDCAQIGEPSTQRFDDITGKWRSTYETFKQVAENTWEYCGDCFRGENVRRGNEMQCV